MPTIDQDIFDKYQYGDNDYYRKSILNVISTQLGVAMALPPDLFMK